MASDWIFRSGFGDTFRELRRFQDEVNRMFSGVPLSGASDFPLLNIWANEEGVVVSAELPGVDPDSIKVSVHRNTLTLSGERRTEKPDDKAVALRIERPSGAFSRTVTLPFAVDADRVGARTESGVLVVQLPRPEEDKPKRIQIATA